MDIGQLTAAIKRRQLTHTSVWIETRDAVRDTLDILLECLEEVNTQPNNKITLYVSEDELDTLQMAVRSLNSEGGINTIDLRHMLKLLETK